MSSPDWAEQLRAAVLAGRAARPTNLANGPEPRPDFHPHCAVCHKPVGAVSVIWPSGARECHRCYLGAENSALEGQQQGT